MRVGALPGVSGLGIDAVGYIPGRIYGTRIGLWAIGHAGRRNGREKDQDQDSGSIPTFFGEGGEDHPPAWNGAFFEKDT
ncbi:uncharacterized protein N7482_005727 [Penicillium canariense]|uniref:Uncharacterized protein n=1 Tax=Penicillium canariense TaxID=189055 RepID=A0A9W9LNA3_9EURO|nr:uncharacterized protein N7482_005727 [Penicillium canariense]KAJ5166946.1 hypothetical protein N7482_005727 [Penicillium canariense]